MTYEVANIRNPTDSRDLATKFFDTNNLLFVASIRTRHQEQCRRCFAVFKLNRFRRTLTAHISVHMLNEYLDFTSSP